MCPCRRPKTRVLGASKASFVGRWMGDSDGAGTGARAGQDRVQVVGHLQGQGRARRKWHQLRGSRGTPRGPCSWIPTAHRPPTQSFAQQLSIFWGGGWGV